MNGITKRCISIGRGDKDPLKRVNYEFGLVLGVDEFITEQCYFLEKAYAENRALHGFGTVSGLQVNIRENADTIEVLVERGMGIDQYGRMFIVTQDQCADLLAWIEKQELEAGEQTIYVTARYSECLTDLVPIAGQPCADSSTLNAASRIKDIAAIELSSRNPHLLPNTAYHAVLNLAEFISRVRVDATIENSPVDTLIDRLQEIISPENIVRPPEDYATFATTIISDIVGVAGTQLISVLPQDAERLRNAFFIYWVTEVRPTVEPDVLDADAPSNNNNNEPLDPDILLATIELVIPDADNELVFDEIVVNNNVRPYLLHTQLIQELFRFPQLTEGGGVIPAAPNNEFASIYADESQRIRLWLHITDNVVLDTLRAGLTIIRVGTTGALNELNFTIDEEAIRANQRGRYYLITLNARLADGDYLIFSFDTQTIEMGTNAGETLQEYIAALPHTFINYVRGARELVAYHIVHQPDGGAQGLTREEVLEIVSLRVRPTIPFVTITPIAFDRDNFIVTDGYEMWFHLDGEIFRNEGLIGSDQQTLEGIVQVFHENASGSVATVSMRYEQRRDNVWFATFAEDFEVPPQLLRFGFMLENELLLRAFNPQPDVRDYQDFGSIGEYMEATRQNLHGHRIRSEEFGEMLVVYVREQASARRLVDNG